MSGLHYGCTEINFGRYVVTISHAGNMGTQISQVRENVDKLLFEGAFDQLQREGIENGDPSYMYTLKMSKQQYREIVHPETMQ